MGKSGNRYYDGPVSDHFDGRLFFNPGGIAPLGFRDLLKWQFGGGRTPWPERRDSPFPPARPSARIDGRGLSVTMVGHATLLIQTAGLNILTDPVWSNRASPVRFAGPARVNPPGIRFDDLPPIDIVLVSHNHYDHLDLATLKRLQAVHRPRIVTPLGNDRIIAGALGDARITTMDWGDGLDLKEGVSLAAEPMHHWSARGMGDRRMALWAAFVLTTPAGHVYHVGDTGFHGGSNYRAAGAKYGGFRLAILPFGAYEPRWFMQGVHQNPEEAVEGMLACGAAYVAGHHWGTFRLTNEGIDAPVEALQKALDARGIARDRFRPLHPGEVFDVPETG
ncbi:MBL fold metallo-hydrolase [Ensifer soli]|uniref:MBL fold metallo-hydrolase n=1 Tax=Ciceribacter sp. sgz301302 TaxID=3342379 RepID=UPI0035B93B19